MVRNPSVRKTLIGFTTLVAVLAVGLVTALQLTQTEQELRQKASTPNGQVELTMSAPSLYDGSTSTIDLFVNTHEFQIDGVQAILTVTSQSQNSLPEISVDFLEDSGLVPIIAPTVNLLPNGLGAQIFIVGISKNGISGSPFSTNGPVKFAQINVLTKGENNDVQVNFDINQSKATIAGSSGEVNDLLKTPLAQTFRINPAQLGTNAPTTAPGIGGQNTVKSCNESCNNSAECAEGLFCDQARCRRANNPSDATCAIPTTSSNRSCNEYCSDARDCESSLTCYYNKCRSPQDLTNDTCTIAEPTDIPAQPTTVTRVTATVAPRVTESNRFVETIADNTVLTPVVTRPFSTSTPRPSITATPAAAQTQESSSNYLAYLVLFLLIFGGIGIGFFVYEKNKHLPPEMQQSAGIHDSLHAAPSSPQESSILDHILTLEREQGLQPSVEPTQTADKPVDVNTTPIADSSTAPKADSEPTLPIQSESSTSTPATTSDSLDQQLTSIEDFFDHKA